MAGVMVLRLPNVGIKRIQFLELFLVELDQLRNRVAVRGLGGFTHGTGGNCQAGWAVSYLIDFLNLFFCDAVLHANAHIGEVSSPCSESRIVLWDTETEKNLYTVLRKSEHLAGGHMDVAT